MFARIPGFRKNPSDSSLQGRQDACRKFPQLDPLAVQPSAVLWRLQLAFHCILALLLLWAFLPWLFSGDFRSSGVWWVGLLLAWLGLAASLGYIYIRRASATGTLSLTDTGWHWQGSWGVRDMVLTGDPLVWPTLVILPFRQRQHRRRHTLILLPDSVAAHDLRRLRIWLRTGLSQPRPE